MSADMIYSGRIRDARGRGVHASIWAQRQHVPEDKLQKLIRDTLKALRKEAADWPSDKLLVTAHVCEKVRPASDTSEYIALTLEDADGNDGGFLHVPGWKEAS